MREYTPEGSKVMSTLVLPPRQQEHEGRKAAQNYVEVVLIRVQRVKIWKTREENITCEPRNHQSSWVRRIRRSRNNEMVVVTKRNLTNGSFHFMNPHESKWRLSAPFHRVTIGPVTLLPFLVIHTLQNDQLNSFWQRQWQTKTTFTAKLILVVGQNSENSSYQSIQNILTSLCNWQGIWKM